jgi:hypothetical protein
MMGDSTLGRTWRVMMRACVAPTARAPAEARCEHDAHADHDVEEAGTERGADRHGEHQRRNGLDGVAHAHDRVVDQTSEVSGEQAERHADGDGDRHRHEAREQ